MLLDQFRIETIMTGRHGRMGCKHGGTSNFTQCVIERVPVFIHSLANNFQRRKCAMPLVEVEYTRSDSQRSQRPDTSDTKHQFLSNASPFVSTVQP